MATSLGRHTRAYRIENEVAEFPRILVSEKAKEEWNNLKFNQNMCVERDGRLMVNGLIPHKNYIEEEYRTVYFESYYKRIQKIIDHKLSELEQWTEERRENQLRCSLSGSRYRFVLLQAG